MLKPPNLIIRSRSKDGFQLILSVEGTRMETGKKYNFIMLKLKEKSVVLCKIEFNFFMCICKKTTGKSL